MKRYTELVVTGVIAMLASLLVGAVTVGSYKKTIDTNTENITALQKDATKESLASHIIDNMRRFEDIDRRLVRTESASDRLNQVLVELGEIKTRLGDLQDRLKKQEYRVNPSAFKDSQ